MFRSVCVLLVCTAAAALSDLVESEPALLSGPFAVRAPSGGRERQGVVSAKALFGLVTRSSGCGQSGIYGPQCPEGQGCCPAEEECCGQIECIVTGETCCNNSYSCSIEELCCSGGCMPSDAVCCNDGTYSDIGEGMAGCGTSGTGPIFSPGPTFTRANPTAIPTTEPIAGVTEPTESEPTYVPSSNMNSGCNSAQKVVGQGAEDKGVHGHGGGGSSSSGNSGCPSAGSVTDVSLGTLFVAVVGTGLFL